MFFPTFLCIISDRIDPGIPLGRPIHRWEDNIKIGVKETGCESAG
jgi:hypothetical protein